MDFVSRQMPCSLHRCKLDVCGVDWDVGKCAGDVGVNRGARCV